MEGIINNISRLLDTYGFQATTIIVFTIIVVNLIKKPIIKYAIKYAEESSYDKSVVTKYITFLPYAIAFMFVTIYALVNAKFDVNLVQWNNLWAEALIYGSVAIATYEGVKKQLEAYASTKNKEKEIETSKEGFKEDDLNVEKIL